MNVITPNQKGSHALKIHKPLENSLHRVLGIHILKILALLNKISLNEHKCLQNEDIN